MAPATELLNVCRHRSRKGGDPVKITFLAEKDDTITVTEARSSPEWPEWVVKVVIHRRYGRSFGAVFSLHADTPPNVTSFNQPGGQQLVMVEVPAEEV